MILLRQARTYAWLFSVTRNQRYLAEARRCVAIYKRIYVKQTDTFVVILEAA